MKKILMLDLKYSGIQIVYYGAWCALLGYASAFLLDRGFSNSVIGMALALVSLLSVFLQPNIGSFVDRNQSIELRKLIILIVIIMNILGLGMMFFKGIGLILVFIGTATFYMTTMPLLNSLAFVFEKYGIEINYGLGRGLGSGAYAIASIVIGYMVEDYGSYILPMIYIFFNILLIIITYSFVVPKNETKIADIKEEEEPQLSLLDFVRKYKRFMIFLIGLVCIYFTMTILTNFFIQVVRNVGGSESDMGTADFIAAMIELPTMIGFNWLYKRFGCNKLLKIGVISFVLKDLLTWCAVNVSMIYMIQILQMTSYGLVGPASIYYTNRIINHSDLVKGQALLSMAYTGSGIIANLIGGILIDGIGIHNVLLVGVGIAFIGMIIVFASLKKEEVVK